MVLMFYAFCSRLKFCLAPALSCVRYGAMVSNVPNCPIVTITSDIESLHIEGHHNSKESISARLTTMLSDPYILPTSTLGAILAENKNRLCLIALVDSEDIGLWTIPNIAIQHNLSTTFTSDFRTWSLKYLNRTPDSSEYPELPINFTSICARIEVDPEVCLKEFYEFARKVPTFTHLVRTEKRARIPIDTAFDRNAKVFDYKNPPTKNFEFKTPNGLKWQDTSLLEESELIGHLMSLNEPTSIFERFILPTKMKILQYPKPPNVATPHETRGVPTVETKLEPLMFFYVLRESEFGELVRTGRIAFRKLEDISNPEFYQTVFSSSVMQSFAQCNLTLQKGWSKPRDDWSLVLFGVRFVVNRVNDLIVKGVLKPYKKGTIKGLSAETTIEFEQVELNNCLLARLNISIQKWHDDHYRSDAAFMSGQIRSYGSIANPSMFRSSNVERNDILHRLSYQALSVIGQRASMDFDKSDFGSIIQNAATYYLNLDETSQMHMCIPIQILPKVDNAIQRAYRSTFNILSDTVPMFLTQWDPNAIRRAIEHEATRGRDPMETEIEDFHMIDDDDLS